MKWLVRIGGLLALVGLGRKVYQNREAIKATGRYVKDAAGQKLAASPVTLRKKRSGVPPARS